MWQLNQDMQSVRVFILCTWICTANTAPEAGESSDDHPDDK